MNNKVGKARHREARGALEYRVVNDNARRDEYFQWKLYFLLVKIILFFRKNSNIERRERIRIRHC